MDVFKEGVLLSFDSKITKSELENLNNYTIRRWNYLRSSKYGSGHYRLDGTPGEERFKAIKPLPPKTVNQYFSPYQV